MEYSESPKNLFDSYFDIVNRYLDCLLTQIVSNLKSYVLISLVVLCYAQYGAAEKIVSLAATDWPPYAGKDLENYGFVSEIVVEAFSRVGYTVKISFMPWKRVLGKVEQGKYDAAYPAYFSEERANVYALSRPFAIGPIGFYKRRDVEIAYKTLRDLQPYTIGVVRGYVTNATFDSVEYLKKDVADNDEQNLTKLLRGRVDLIVIDKLTAQYILSTAIPEGNAALEFLDPPIEKKLIHLMFSRNIEGYEQRLQDFHRGLEQVLEDGTVKRILKKHGVD